MIDTPVVACDIVEHRVLALCCTCGQRHRSVFPTTVTQAVQYGPNVRALGVHLTQGQLLPFARAAQLINDLYGISISPATLLAWVDEARVALQATAGTIANSLRAAPLVHADESGLRVEGKLHWLHVAANDSHTWYGVHAKRGMEAIAAQAILPQRLGVLIHDCWAPYWQLAGTHALCNADLLRGLLYVQELTGERWPLRMSELLLRANELREAARRKNIVLGDKAALRTFYDAILSEGKRRHPARLKPSGKAGRVKQSVAFNLLLRLRRYADAVLLFVSDPAVPFTNNLG